MAKRTCDTDGCERIHRARGLCGTHYNRRYGHTPTVKSHNKTCEACGVDYVTTRAHGRTCSLDCRRWINPRISKVTALDWERCDSCGNWDSRGRPCPRPICARLRHHVATAHTSGSFTWVAGRCLRCGTTFVADHLAAKSLFCSTPCARYAVKARRRARVTTTQQRPFSRIRVFERDGWRCHLCNRTTRPETPWQHPDHPTIDHLVPISEGGPHTEENAATAHRRCNTRRGTRGAAQLRLTA